MQVNSKNLPFLLSDIIAFYGALLLSLIFRLGFNFDLFVFWLHLKPFTLLLGLWLVIFYITGLYEIQNFSKRHLHLKLTLLGVFVSLWASVIFFYLLPIFALTPKTILVLLVTFFLLIDFPIRSLLYYYYLQTRPPLNVLLLGAGVDTKELASYFEDKPQLGYKIYFWELVGKTNSSLEPKKLKELIQAYKITTVVISDKVKQNKKLTAAIYQELLAGTNIVSLSEFYENSLGKVSLDELEEEWFLEKLIPRNRFYLLLKRILDLALALTLLIIILPLWPIIIFLVKSSSRGSIFFTQRRVGLREREIVVSKFRTMHQLKKGEVRDVLMKKGQLNLESKENLSRIFFFGKLLRRTHLDELPQVFNVLKGELSFIGPRVEFVEMHNHLKSQIPYYQIRTIIKPGLTGWAQIHGQTSNTVKAARERLAYDIYYIKNRSFVLDLVISLKTLRTILTFSGV